MRELLICINKNSLIKEENKWLCLKKFGNIMLENKKLNKKIYIDIANANKNELKWFGKYKSFVIFSFIPVNVLLIYIKKGI